MISSPNFEIDPVEGELSADEVPVSPVNPESLNKLFNLVIPSTVWLFCSLSFSADSLSGGVEESFSSSLYSERGLAGIVIGMSPWLLLKNLVIEIDRTRGTSGEGDASCSVTPSSFWPLLKIAKCTMRSVDEKNGLQTRNA